MTNERTIVDDDLFFLVPVEPRPAVDAQLGTKRRKATRPKAVPSEPKRKPATKPTEIYRAYDAAGILLYVGVSANTPVRLKQHASSKTWWHLVADVQVRDESAYGDFLVDEFEACVNEFPMFNIDGVPWRCWQSSIGRADFDRLRSRAEIAGAVARLDDAGVQGRLSVLHRAYPSTYAAAVESAGRPSELAEDWRRRVLTAAEERFLDLEKREIPGRRRTAPKKTAAANPAWRFMRPADVPVDEFVLQLCLAVNEMTDEEVTAQAAEIAGTRALTWQEYRRRAEMETPDEGIEADRYTIRAVIRHFVATDVWPIVVVPTVARSRQAWAATNPQNPTDPDAYEGSF